MSKLGDLMLTVELSGFERC